MSLLVNYHYLDTVVDFDYHDKRRSAFQNIYADYLSAEPGIGGRVLDIGCGHGENPTYRLIASHIKHLDGCDPFPVITPPAHLENRWTCRLEDVPVAPSTYDMAYSYNVVEHVENVRSFLSKAVEILKPGAVYWSMSPNARHPFTWATRLAQLLGVKLLYRKFVQPLANDYPAYYRLSHDKWILDAISALNLPVSRIDFYYIPCIQWDMFFPSFLKAIPYLLDRFYLLRQPKRSFIFMFRLEKASG
jgi:2-polyprenyl-3-methyl-5-hydroxy-6-metoxy-1,4-benzoquinol methylase